MLMTIKKYLTLFVITMALMGRGTWAFAASDSATEQSIMDDSLRDFSIVLAAGAVGALLGLSTLSFVEEPSKHLKNVAVGGAVGIVIGVGAVIFSQATRTSSTISGLSKEIPMNPEKYETLARLEFSDYKIAKNYLKVPSVGYNFSF